MSRFESSIDLPPPRPPVKRSPLNNIVWILITCLALVGGAFGGIYLGKKNSSPQSPTPGLNPSPAIEKTLKEAKAAIHNGDWVAAGKLYRSVLEKHPANPEAKASLPLIERYLEESNGNLVVTSEPEGAKVTVPGREPLVTPAEIKQLPAGKMQLRIEKNGFEPVVKTVAVVEHKTILLPKVALQKSVGSLNLVSEPPGADYKLIKTGPKGSDEMGELIRIGKTPEKVGDLEAGEYEVKMTAKGWPDYTRKIRVEHNRSAAVSAVFAKGGINVVSDPVGAEVWASLDKGVWQQKGITPLTLTDLPPGRHQIEVRHKNWAPIRRTVDVKGNITRELEFAWERSIVSFSSEPEGATVYLGNQRIGNGLAVTPFQVELPEGDYLFEARIPGLHKISKGVYVERSSSSQVSFPFEYGSVSIQSDPPGATVVANGLPIGLTPLNRAVVAPGKYSYTISKKNFKPANLSGIVESGGQLAFNTKLITDEIPIVNRNFTNGLGQKMIWFDNLGGWVADTEVTQATYERITKENPSDIKDPKHPVDSVSWYDASKFCSRLTMFENALGNVPSDYIYRLPTDAEWSTFAGTTSLTNAITSAYTRYRSSRPVGSVAPNDYGLYDIRGNLTEWVQDWYSQQILNRAEKEGARVRPEWVGTDRKVLRGGSWLRSTQTDLEIPYRRGAPPSQENANDVGFRVVLMPK
ncbi:MAG: PEGA domain-containing protein [Verrucomicrobiales bacterium]|nr:PEGA domain-containing protein [Verrucomicrobiales bacterium]